jgi:DNA-binding Lrp family transcriptional regulator
MMRRNSASKGSGRSMTDLDSFDRRLLLLVQRDAAATSEALAAEVGLSASAIQRRLKRLRETGVITATVALVDPTKVGRPSFFIVGLEVERERPELLAELRRWLAAEDCVQEAFYVTGAWDIILIVTAFDIEGYDLFMSRMMAGNPNVRRFTTNVVLAAHKRRLFIPIAEAPDKA